jgi:hypothetical protein
MFQVNQNQNIFTFNFSRPEKYQHILQQNFGRAMDEFLQNLDYSKKYEVLYQHGGRWLSLPLTDKAGV